MMRSLMTHQCRYNWNQRQFGVEIETIVPENGKFRDIDGLRQHLWKQQPISLNGWKLKRGENNGGHRNDGIYFGAELISPNLYWNEREIKSMHNICSELQQIPAMTNYSTAFHVHCAANDLTELEIKNIATNYGHFENIIDHFNMKNYSQGYGGRLLHGFLPSNWRNCSDKRAVSLDRRNHAQKRYFQFNSKVLTSENEHHHGTVDAESVLNWIRFNLVLIARSNSDGVFDFMRIRNDEREKLFWQFIDDADLERYFKLKANESVSIFPSVRYCSINNF